MMERHKTVYLLDEKERKIKNQIAEDFLRGGNGVTSLKTQSRLKKSQNNDSFINVFNTSIDTLLTGHSDNNEDFHRRFSEYNLKTSVGSTDGHEDVEHDQFSDLWAPNIRIALFSNDVLPKSYTLNDGALKLKRDKFKINKSTWTDAVYTIRHKHYITAMLYRPSLYVSRTLRFVDMCRKVLLYLFIDTLIYGVFFPSDATCTAFTKKAACTATPSKVSKQMIVSIMKLPTICNDQEKNQSEINLTMFTTLFILNHSQIISGSNLCTWNNESGCSINPPPKSTTFVLLISSIIVIFVIVFDYFIGYIQMEYAAKRPRLESWGLSSDSWLGSVQHKRERDKSLISNSAVSHTSDGGDREVPLESKRSPHRKSHTRDFSNVEGDFISNEIFNDFLSPAEECVRLITRVQDFLAFDGSASSNHIRSLSRDSGSLSSEHLAAMKAIGSQLMVNFDGTMKPITMRQRLFYSNRQNLIEKKILVARAKAIKICKTIDEMEVLDDNLKDIALMRKFILEQVSIFYRFSLKKNFMDIDGVPPEFISPSLWLAAWILIISALLFFLFWIFAWGVRNGGQTLDLWGTNYGISIAQDILVLELGKVCIIYVFAILSAKPQLQVIKRVINDRALSLVQDTVVFNDRVSVVQHFSPACRAARSSGLSKLSASKILRSMTDADMERCKEHRDFTLGNIIFYTIMMAAVIAALSEILVDQLLTFILSSMLLAFLLLHSKLLAISPLLLICIYGIFGGISLYYLGVYVPSVKRAHKARAKRAQTAKEAVRSRPRNTLGKQTSTFAGGLLRGFRRFGARTAEYAGYLHTIITFEKIERRREKRRYNDQLWCSMNKASNVLISAVSPSVISPESMLSRKFEGKMMTSKFGNDIPFAILRMRESGTTLRRETVAKSRKITPTCDFPPNQSPLGMKLSIPAVQSPRNIGKLAIAYIANKEITTNPEVALRRMLERHLLGAESYENGDECSFFDLENASSTFISNSELCDMLDWTWITFYPCGQKLTAELKLEVDDKFESWRKSPMRLEACSIDSSEEMSGVWGSSFTTFAEWFLQACSAIDLHVMPTRQSEPIDQIPFSCEEDEITVTRTFSL